MAMAEPHLVPALGDAHEYPGYVQFLQAHRHRLEQESCFPAWDARINALVEREAQMHGYSLADREEWDELVAAVAMPIRCAFWYGWETVHNLKKRFDQHVQAAQAQQSHVQVIKVRNAPDAPEIAQSTTATEQTSEAFWESIATNMLGAMQSPQRSPSQPLPQVRQGVAANRR